MRVTNTSSSEARWVASAPRGTPRALIARVVGREVVEFEAPADALDEATLRALPGVQAARRSGPGFALTVEQTHVAIPALLELLAARRLPLEALSTHRATLEDVFVTLTGRRLRD